MLNKKYIKIGTIFKRSTCLNSGKNNAIYETNVPDEVYHNYTALSKLLNDELSKSTIGITPTIKQYCTRFINGLANVKEASSYYNEALSILGGLNKINESFADTFANDLSSQVIPYISTDNINGFKNSLNRDTFNITENQKYNLLETANQCMTADRIIANNKKLSTRHNLENIICKIPNVGLKRVVEECIDIVDNYKLPKYAKMNVCLEELFYVTSKHNINCDKKELVKSVVESFLLRYPDLDNQEIKDYQKVLSENYCYTLEDVQPSIDIFEDSKDSLSDRVNEFLTNTVKSPELLINICSFINSFSVQDIIHNINKLINLIWDCFRNDIFVCDSKKYIDIINELFTQLESNDSLSKEDLYSIISAITESLNNIDSINSDSSDIKERYYKFRSTMNSGLDMLKGRINILYSDNNLNTLRVLNTEAAETIPLNEFKIFKFHNLVNAAFHLDRWIANKVKRQTTKAKLKRKVFKRKVNNVLFGENANFENFNVYDYIGEDGKCDICVEQYYIDESCEKEINDFLAETCAEYNNYLITNGYDESVKTYYIINPSIAEIHIEDNTGIVLNEDEKVELKNHINPQLEVYINDAADLYELEENYMNPANRTINETLVKCFDENDELTTDHYQLALEVLSYLNIDKNTLELFTENFKNYRYNYLVESGIINESSDDDYIIEEAEIDSYHKKFIKENNVPITIQLEAYNILINILESGPTIKKPQIKAPKLNKPSINNKNTTDNGDKANKKDIGGVNLTSMKLALQGLKAKFGEFNQKQKEASKNADYHSRRFAKALKDAFISDRREAIIKGSVIPSFSKLVRWGLVLTGLGIITHNPIVPAIAAIGAFAVSKNLTKKERLLLLDDIETELEVVDKELQLADSKNQLKKYRALLKYKKDLQRQYQRIKYNIRVGRDILPGSEEGVGHMD